MRLTGTVAAGIRLPIISAGDDLVDIVTENVLRVIDAEGKKLAGSDIIAVTEAIVAKAEGNFAKISDIASDVRAKFGGTEIGLVYPILSRNRFLNILKGVAMGAEKVHILLSYPHDEVGNPIMDIDLMDEVADKLAGKIVTAKEFQEVAGKYLHTFTGMDYVGLYESVSPNIQIYFSNDPRDILKYTKNVLVAEIHNRNRTRERLLKAGAEKVFTLSDILSESVNGSGFNSKYGILGSNLSTEETLKLFPNKSQEFVTAVQARFKEKTGVSPEVMVYGDGAFKDPVCGIWELADPVVSPGYTERLGQQPHEIKIKLVADTVFGELKGDEKREAVTKMIKEKKVGPDSYREGTTPRVYADLVGSLCDLMGGSGDKGTPVILVRGYFDDYSVE
ncbi:MAG: coenzyme F420-0:L-glutamate ligase [Defluviitaleaceae bacterium]|nr:coenzyme F420-0:L-glutamate ligase [Defluviitaleaceae bacterium]MCL2262725.1 coenzyme F420-0:L-glutamate ligase [Defluviitaleaceae bacterium]